MAGLYIQAARGQAGVRERPPSTIIESHDASRFAALFFLVASAAASAQIPVTKEAASSGRLRKQPVKDPGCQPSAWRDDARPLARSGCGHDRDEQWRYYTNAVARPTVDRSSAPIAREHRDIGYAGKPTSHTFQNVGQTTYQLFAVENLKPSGWSTTAALTAAGTMLAKESRSFRVYTSPLGKTGSRPLTPTRSRPSSCS